jgi:hypothetical protein
MSTNKYTSLLGHSLSDNEARTLLRHIIAQVEIAADQIHNSTRPVASIECECFEDIICLLEAGLSEVQAGERENE